MNYFMLIHIALYFLPTTLSRAAESIGYPQLETGISNILRTIKNYICGTKDAATYFLDDDSPTYAIWFLCAVTCAAILSAIFIVFLKNNLEKNSERIRWWWKNIIRLCLVWWMLYYGIIKAIPDQIVSQTPAVLFMRVYELPRSFYVFGPLGVSTPYEMLTGWIEIIGGILLLIPRLITFGGLLNIVSMVQIAIYNILFDIPVSLNALLLCCYEVILLYPFLQNLYLYLLDRKDLLRKRRIPIIRLNSIKFRRICIGIYTLITVGYIFQFTRLVWMGYQEEQPTHSSLDGVWITESIQTKSQNIPAVFSHKNWDYLAIATSGLKGNTSSIEITASNALATKLDMSGQFDINKHTMDLSTIYNQSSGNAIIGVQPLTGVSARIHYDILKTPSSMPDQTRETHVQKSLPEPIAIFTVYLNRETQPSLIIHSQKYPIAAQKYLGPEWLRK